jgi:predicted PurR-regulated permease PerM
MGSIGSPQQSRIFALLCGLAVATGLYLAKEILLPFALAVFLSFLLAPS